MSGKWTFLLMGGLVLAFYVCAAIAHIDGWQP